MNNKIIGFTISRHEIDHSDIDIFNSDLNLAHKSVAGLNLYLWGINDLESCVIEGKYTLSFPLSLNLLDRNVVIDINTDHIIVENDWLGAIPVYYNSRDMIVSTLCLKTLTDNELDSEGLLNYFEFGFSILEKTPFANVRFMRFYSSLKICPAAIDVTNKRDPLLDIEFNDNGKPEEALRKVEDYLSEACGRFTGNIIIPTSGGFDSRLLNIMVKDKKRIKSFTYGGSRKQTDSQEVITAKKLCEMLGVDWQQIILDGYYNYIPQWFKLFGFSTHLHGMYHIDFYEKIRKSLNTADGVFLSGIFADVWAGSINYEPMNKPDDLIKYSYAHGLCVDRKNILQSSPDGVKKSFYDEYKNIINVNKARAVFTIRMKIILISYITSIPEYFGYPVCTPYLNFEIVKAFLEIPEDERKNRIWQKIYFRETGMNIEEMVSGSTHNLIDLINFRQHNFEFIKEPFLPEYIKPGFINKVNNYFKGKHYLDYLILMINSTPKIWRIGKMLGLSPSMRKYFNSYLTLKSVEMAKEMKE